MILMPLKISTTLKRINPLRLAARIKRNLRRRKAIFETQIQVKSAPAPTEALHFSEIPRGYFCAQYARLAAERLFGLKYTKAAAWDFRNVNHVVWRKRNATRGLETIIQPGQILGIRNPHSLANRWWRPYTHVALVVGKKNGKILIMHRIGSNDILEPLHDALKRRKWTVEEVLEPESNG